MVFPVGFHSITPSILDIDLDLFLDFSSPHQEVLYRKLIRNLNMLESAALLYNPHWPNTAHSVLTHVVFLRVATDKDSLWIHGWYLRHK
jgi:hypothetical protein